MPVDVRGCASLRSSLLGDGTADISTRYVNYVYPYVCWGFLINYYGYVVYFSESFRLFLRRDAADVNSETFKGHDDLFTYFDSLVLQFIKIHNVAFFFQISHTFYRINLSKVIFI